MAGFGRAKERCRAKKEVAEEFLRIQLESFEALCDQEKKAVDAETEVEKECREKRLKLKSMRGATDSQTKEEETWSGCHTSASGRRRDRDSRAQAGRESNGDTQASFLWSCQRK